jgi:hypothetical protein
VSTSNNAPILRSVKMSLFGVSWFGFFGPHSSPDDSLVSNRSGPTDGASACSAIGIRRTACEMYAARADFHDEEQVVGDQAVPTENRIRYD